MEKNKILRTYALIFETAINSIPLRPNGKSINEKRDGFYFHFIFENTNSLMLGGINKCFAALILAHRIGDGWGSQGGGKKHSVFSVQKILENKQMNEAHI